MNTNWPSLNKRRHKLTKNTYGLHKNWSKYQTRNWLRAIRRDDDQYQIHEETNSEPLEFVSVRKFD